MQTDLSKRLRSFYDKWHDELFGLPNFSSSLSELIDSAEQTVNQDHIQQESIRHEFERLLCGLVKGRYVDGTIKDQMLSDYFGFSLRQLQSQHTEWRLKNFPDQKWWHALLGMQEELGENSHAVLKHTQSIRGFDVPKMTADVEDGIGDLIMFTCGLCSLMDIDFETAVKATWHEVRKRDWIKNPENGITA